MRKCLFSALLPGPIVFGKLIDGTCLIWQRKCGRRGSCLLYDVTHYRYITHGTALAAFVMAFLMCLVGWWLVRGVKTENKEDVELDTIDKKKPDNEQEDEKKKLT